MFEYCTSILRIVPDISKGRPYPWNTCTGTCNGDEGKGYQTLCVRGIGLGKTTSQMAHLIEHRALQSVIQ